MKKQKNGSCPTILLLIMLVCGIEAMCPLPPYDLPPSIPDSPLPQELAAAFQRITELLQVETSTLNRNLYLAITYGNQVLYSEGFGVANTSVSVTKPTAHTIYPIASCTKTF